MAETIMSDVMLAYDTPCGRAWYIGGSGLVGEAQYTLRGRVLSHAAVLALASRKNRRGRVPTADTGQMNADKKTLSACICRNRRLKKGNDMKITLDQYPGLVQNIETLGTVDLSDSDQTTLINLAQLLGRAYANVERALDAQLKAKAARYEREHGEPPF